MRRDVACKGVKRSHFRRSWVLPLLLRDVCSAQPPGLWQARARILLLKHEHPFLSVRESPCLEMGRARLWLMICEFGIQYT